MSTCLFNHQSFAFQVTDPLPADEKITIHINVEICSSTFHDQIAKRRPYIGRYLIFFGHTNGKKFDENALYSYEDGVLEIQSFKYIIKSNEIITILIQRAFKKDYVENCYVSVFCKYNFKLYDIDNPDIIFPDIKF